MNKTLAEVIEAHQNTLAAGELADLLTAFDTIKENGGCGQVIVSLDGSGVSDIKTVVNRKPIKPMPILGNIARWPRFILKPIRASKSRS